MRIIQLTQHLLQRGGIGEEIMRTRRLLEQAGYQVETWAGWIASDIPEGIAATLDQENPEIGQEDILLLHFYGGGDVFQRIPGIPCRKVLVYHGIPQARLFEGYDYHSYQAAVDGERFLRQWADQQLFDAVLTFSQYHCEELLSMGVPEEDITVLPGYPAEVRELEEMPDSDVLEDFGDEQTTILSLGEIAPDCRQQDTLRAFAYYQKYIDPSARLIFAGGGQDTAYGVALNQYLKEAGVKNVIFMDQVSRSELSALYQSADVLVYMSEQENLDLALVEAMEAGIPVLAYGTGVVQAILGGAGIVLGQKNMVCTAKWIGRIVKDSKLREMVLKAQRRRLDKLKRANAEQELLKHIAWFVDEHIRKPHDINRTGAHNRLGERIDGTLYDICQREMSRIGAPMPVSREAYLLSVKAGQ